MTGFPSHILKPEYKVLSLFTAAFGGAQDIRFLHDAGIKTCVMVDINAEALERMKYPFDKICADCYEMIDKVYASSEPFDIVTCDQWTGQDEKIHDEYFEKIRAIAPISILSISQRYLNTKPSLPTGTYYKRSDHNGGVFWRLLTP